MLIDEEKQTQEVEMAQKIAKELSEQHQLGANTTSHIQSKVKEPLITKAYDAFRKQKSVNKN